MESSLARSAIAAALSCDWKKAIEVNSQILKSDPKDVNALNRIAKAYAEQGDLEKASTVTQKVLKLDPANKIASKCVLRWKNFKKNTTSTPHAKFSFIEEPTRTKVVSLINLGDAATILGLDCGDIVKLSPQIHRVNLDTMDNKYIGRFPDNIALKFIHLIKMGGEFEVMIKTATQNDVKVFIRALTKNGF